MLVVDTTVVVVEGEPPVAVLLGTAVVVLLPAGVVVLLEAGVVVVLDAGIVVVVGRLEGEQKLERHHGPSGWTGAALVLDATTIEAIVR